MLQGCNEVSNSIAEASAILFHVAVRNILCNAIKCPFFCELCASFVSFVVKFNHKGHEEKHAFIDVESITFDGSAYFTNSVKTCCKSSTVEMLERNTLPSLPYKIMCGGMIMPQ